MLFMAFTTETCLRRRLYGDRRRPSARVRTAIVKIQSAIDWRHGHVSVVFDEMNLLCEGKKKKTQKKKKRCST